MIHSALFTDLYELTMGQGFFKKNMNRPSVFDVFFRRHPFSGGFSVFAGLDPLLDAIENFRFSAGDLEWLEKRGIFDKDFLEYLASFRFSGDIYAMKEGSIVFPDEPLIRVHAPMIEAAIIEGLVLNIINFQSLIATKTARISLASNRGSIMEFGLRRAQGPDGALSASRAAFLGGAKGTSNVLAARLWGIPAMGTMAHSWIMSFDNEEEAFSAYADIYPDTSVFLIDTYNTLESGLRAAIAVGKRLAERGKNFGVRLDSGDIQYLSTEVRKALDREGLTKATITVSNELTEEIIESLVQNRAPIDTWGVGTHLVTGGNESSFTGVYKLAERTTAAGTTEPTMKLSDNPAKTTNPGVKQVWRLFNEDGSAKADVLTLGSEHIPPGECLRYYHPANDLQSFSFAAAMAEPLLAPVMRNGARVNPAEKLGTIQKRVRSGLSRFDKSYLRILNPHVYKVSLSETLKDLKLAFLGRTDT